MRVKIREPKPNWAGLVFACIFGAFVAVALLYSWVNPLGAFFGWVACLAVMANISKG